MTTAAQVLLVVVACGGIVIVAVLGLIFRELRRSALSESASGLVVLQNQVEALREQVRTSLEGGRLEIDRRLEETQRVVGDVHRGLGEVDRQVRSVQEVASDLKGLQELLRSPKVRGLIGEQLLAELLDQVLPRAHYSLQYEFTGGERVDAVLRVGEGLVSIDAKFPLENFNRMRDAEQEDDPAQARAVRRAFRADVRRHIDAVAKKYIRPGEGTFDFALMYIPAEAVYQEVTRQEADDGLDLVHDALSRKVVPVSPQSFYAYLQVILLGLRGLSIEERAKEIMGRVDEIQRRVRQVGESFEIASRHVGNAQRQLEEAGRRMGRLDSAVDDLSMPRVAQSAQAPSQKRKDAPT
jgi:DNA recombination protein RmuC